MLQIRDFKAPPRLELEGSADVDGLAVTPVILERRVAIVLDIVPHAAGQRDAPRERIGGAGIDRNGIALAKRLERLVGRAVRTER